PSSPSRCSAPPAPWPRHSRPPRRPPGLSPPHHWCRHRRKQPAPRHWPTSPVLLINCAGSAALAIGDRRSPSSLLPCGCSPAAVSTSTVYRLACRVGRTENREAQGGDGQRIDKHRVTRGTFLPGRYLHERGVPMLFRWAATVNPLLRCRRRFFNGADQRSVGEDRRSVLVINRRLWRYGPRAHGPGQ